MTGFRARRTVMLTAAASLVCQCVGGRDLVVTEIAFDGAEFLELQNISDGPLDLHGYTVFGGIDAFLTGILEPGELAVIVELEREFRGDYGNSPRIVAEFQRKLDNDGESIGIRDADGAAILEFVYQTSGPGWPRAPAGGEGTPLELINPHEPTVDLSLGENWRRAYRRDGSPGKETDGDRDGLDDVWEQRYFRGLDRNSEDDPDGDGLDNGAERRLLTDPTSEDTDGDGILDRHETLTGIYVSAEDTGTDPIKRDSDDDGLRDNLEVPLGPMEAGQYRTDPNDPDMDDDSFSDGDEVLYLGDPLNPEIGPKPPAIGRFWSEPEDPRAGESFTLHWDIRGSADRTLSPLPEGTFGIGNFSDSRVVLPMVRTHFIHPGSVWKVDHSDADYGTSWQERDFDDSSWASALAPFGSFPPWYPFAVGWFTELPTWIGEPVPYFRQVFSLPDRVPGNSLQFAWEATGGGCLYLDGQLVKKVRMPEIFDRTSLAQGDGIPGIPEVFTPDPLGPGPLVVAAENHLGLGENVSLYFDVSLACFKPSTRGHTFFLSASNPYGEAERELDLWIADDLPPMQTYSEWAAETIPADGVLGAEARLATRDLDGDGLANLLEFLVGGRPLERDAPPLTIEPVYATYPTARPGTVQHFLVSYPRHRNPANAGIRLEWTIDGITWEALPTVFDPAQPHLLTIATLDDTRELVTCRVDPWPRGRSKLFRLRGVNAER